MKLSDIVDLTLTYSINLSAELMMLITAKSITGTALKLDESAKVITKYYSQILTKISWKDFRMVNGSGLTVKNRFTPEQITAILIYADAQSYNGKKYRSFLPVSGWKASFVNRLNDPDTAFHVWAKTGSINYALGLAGYLYTKSKKKMAFAVFINDRAEREMYDADPDRRAGNSTQKASYWMTRGKLVMDSLVEGWIKEL
jgi:D-alanyl-D-alanine carboxypeptidase/D-alanyl-D-alanine-endopeptidase (penicillin-binding protein 4)